MKKRNANLNRKGLSLIELLLVLVILVAVAGVLIPTFSNVIGQAHGSSSAANIEGVVRQLENHRGMFGAYPDEMDLLLDDTAAPGALVPFGGAVAATELTTIAITDRIADALEEAGIENVIRHPEVPAGEDTQTVFEGTIEAVDFGGTTPPSFVTLGADAVDRLGLDATETYVVLGLGNNNDAIGRSMAAAPLHFLPDGGSNEEIYARFLTIFRIPDEEGAASLATVATVDVHDGAGEIIGLDGHVTEYNHSRE